MSAANAKYSRRNISLHLSLERWNAPKPVSYTHLYPAERYIQDSKDEYLAMAPWSVAYWETSP